METSGRSYAFMISLLCTLIAPKRLDKARRNNNFLDPESIVKDAALQVLYVFLRLTITIDRLQGPYGLHYAHLVIRRCRATRKGLHQTNPEDTFILRRSVNAAHLPIYCYFLPHLMQVLLAVVVCLQLLAKNYDLSITKNKLSNLLPNTHF